MKYSFNVPAMSCPHCKMRIGKALAPFADAAEIEIDLDTKKVSINTETQPATLIQAIESAGYRVEDINKH